MTVHTLRVGVLVRLALCLQASLPQVGLVVATLVYRRVPLAAGSCLANRLLGRSLPHVNVFIRSYSSRCHVGCLLGVLLPLNDLGRSAYLAHRLLLTSVVLAACMLEGRPSDEATPDLIVVIDFVDHSFVTALLLPVVIPLFDLVFGVEKVEDHWLDGLLLLGLTHHFELSPFVWKLHSEVSSVFLPKLFYRFLGVPLDNILGVTPAIAKRAERPSLAVT